MGPSQNVLLDIWLSSLGKVSRPTLPAFVQGILMCKTGGQPGNGMLTAALLAIALQLSRLLSMSSGPNVRVPALQITWLASSCRAVLGGHHGPFVQLEYAALRARLGERHIAASQEHMMWQAM